MARGKTIRLFLRRPLGLEKRDGRFCASNVASENVAIQKCPPPACLLLPENLDSTDPDKAQTGFISARNVASPEASTQCSARSSSEIIIRHLELSPKEIPGLHIAENPSLKRIQLIFGVVAGTTKDHLRHYALTSVNYFQQLVQELTIVIHWSDRLDPPRSYIHVSPKVLLRKQMGDSSVVRLPGILELHIGEHITGKEL